MAKNPGRPRKPAGGSLFPDPAPPPTQPGGPIDWPALLARPPDFTDGPVSDRWFSRLADTLLNKAVLKVAGVPHRLVEVEVYYHGPGHEDVFAHRDPVQLHPGRWYFHRTGGVYRGGSFKGLDLAFGGPVGRDGKAYGGVLFRGLEAPDGTLTDGPSLLVDHVLRGTGCGGVAELDGRIGDRLAWDVTAPLTLTAADEVTERPILRTARVGLTLKFRRAKPADPALAFLLRPCRYLTDPGRTAKGKPHMVLALHAAGVPAADIVARTRCPLAAVRRYVAAFEEGAKETDPTPYYGREWGPADLCRLHGLLAE